MNDDDIKKIIDGVTRNVDTRIGEAFHVIETRLEDHANMNLRAHDEHRKAIGGLQRNMVALWRYVRGSDSEPPPDGSDPQVLAEAEGLDDVARKADAKASHASMELAALEGRMVAGFAQVNSKVNTTTALLERNTAATEKIEKAVTGVVTNPRVQTFVRLVSLAVLGWLATKGYIHQ